MTPVIFRADKENCEIVAVFPTLCDNERRDSMVCYAHIGQHSGCVKEWYRNNTRPAKPEEYKDLLAELEGQGYDDLKIVKRITPAMDKERRKPRVVEITSGYPGDEMGI